MKGFQSKKVAAALFPLFCSSALAINLDLNNEASVRSAAATVAGGLMSYYHNNKPTTAPADVGTFDKPIYWWEAGAIWGGMVDYYTYTGDDTYVKTTQEAIMAQTGPNHDFLVPSHKGDEGNDDQAFWALGVMSAAESGFPQPAGKPKWIEIATNAFNNLITRWDTKVCGGGFRWQIYEENAYGWNYKNSVSNGGVFQLAARLAKQTGDDKYVQWADKIWDWTTKIGFINDKYEVFDGADVRQDCTKIDKNKWTYNTGIYIMGCASMYVHTKDQKWKDRSIGLAKAAGAFFKEGDGIMSEIVCEGRGSCNDDQKSFKGYLARWLSKSAELVPEVATIVKPWLKTSAKAAAATCNGDGKNACGMKWYTGAYDGVPGLGQQISSLETIHGLLCKQNAGSPKPPPPAPEPKPTSKAAPPPPPKSSKAPVPAPAPSQAAPPPPPPPPPPSFTLKPSACPAVTDVTITVTGTPTPEVPPPAPPASETPAAPAPPPASSAAAPPPPAEPTYAAPPPPATGTPVAPPAPSDQPPYPLPSTTLTPETPAPTGGLPPSNTTVPYPGAAAAGATFSPLLTITCLMASSLYFLVL